MYSIVFEKATGKVIEKGTSDVSRFQADSKIDVLQFEDGAIATLGRVQLEHLMIDNPSTAPVVREMSQAEKDALTTRRASDEAAKTRANRESELAVLDSLIEAEGFARVRGTPEAIARADRILAEVNRRKIALGI